VKVATAISGTEAQEATGRSKRKITSRWKVESYRIKAAPRNVETSVSKLAMTSPLLARSEVLAVKTVNVDVRAEALRRRFRAVIMKRVCLVRISAVILARRVITIRFQV
jgi:hypothetical protein